MSTTTRPVEVVQPSFEALARPVLSEVQTSLAELVGSVGTIRRAVDLERALRIEKKLAWQVFRLSRTTDLAEATNVPSLTSARRLIEAARKKGVRERVLTRVLGAFERFEDFAATHGGDRAGLASMVSALSGGVDEQFELNVRKSLFRGHSHVWGVHARVAVRTSIFVPRSGAGATEPGVARIDDIAFVVGDVDMVRRRQGDPLVMMRWLDTKGDRDRRAGADGPTGGASAPPATPGHRVELLAGHSSDPLPQMTNRRSASGLAETDLVFPPGRTGAITIYCSEFREGVTSPPDDVSFGSGTFVTMPMEATIREILVPAGRSDPATARAAVYGRRHHPEQVYELRTADLLPQRETVEYLGVHEGVPELRDVPQHAAAVREVLERHGWHGTRFDVYRCRVEYPLMHTLVMARVDQSRQPPER